ncbi:MAG: LptF/LptG family permease, partial [Nitratireductor sp.]
MKLLERYIFSKAIFAFLAVLFSLSGVIWIIQALTKIDVISSNGQSLLTYFTITFLAVPGLLLAIIPIALLISTGHTINAMNTNSELVVITASGASNKIVVKPFLIIALICSLGAGMVGHFVMPLSLTKLKNIVSSMNADLISLVVREGEFNNVESGLMFHIARRNADGTL